MSLLSTLAMGVFADVIKPFVNDAKDAVLDAAKDTVKDMVAGRMSVEEWAKVAVSGVDKVKERIMNENDYRYVGGKLKFALSQNNPESVKVSFQLYFLDEMQKWQMADAESDIPASKFKNDALDEIRSKGEIVYEVG